ncbi:MAG: hypothetical protein M1548_06855 [Actinobacteria bacterium]|nr:hypothetical protein [Chloroflexota bacterium]MCL5292230.1 hypothetical protein [Actinomycetota bacterium]
MKLFILMSGEPGENSGRTGSFWKAFDGKYADKFIRNLKDTADVCTGCGDKCNHCRLGYKLAFGDRIAGVYVHPDKLLTFVDDAASYLPAELLPHDVAIAINIHQDLLLELPKLAKAAGAQALIVPVEDPDWLDRWIKDELASACENLGLEFAAPKPFCALEEGEGEVIDRFINEFQIGKPKLKLKVEHGVVQAARVLRSAPCGDTYFVAHNIVGIPIGEELIKKSSKFWHSYPCIASMKMDPDFNDTILHRAGHILYEAVDLAVADATVDVARGGRAVSGVEASEPFE